MSNLQTFLRYLKRRSKSDKDSLSEQEIMLTQFMPVEDESDEEWPDDE
jgi:hypothetical protein